jgi:hypothetical protein
MVGTLGPGVGIGKAARFRYVATASQTTFSGADASAQALTLQYTPGFVEVVVDGIWLTPDEYTAINGSSIVFAVGLAAGRVVYVYALSAMSVANTYDKTQNGADITDKAAFRSYLPNPGAIFGLILSTAGASTTLTVAAGYAADSTNTRLMTLASSMAKTTSAWAAGTAVGGLDTGSIANSTWYHFFEIMNVATGAVDVVFSATATPASGPTTMPSGYTLFRRIGSAKTNGSAQWTKFFQYGDEFFWDVPVNDLASTTVHVAAALRTLNTPLGIKTKVYGSIFLSGGDVNCAITAPDQADTAPANGVGPIRAGGAAATPIQMPYIPVFTNTSSQIRVRMDGSTGSYQLNTWGWYDDRGRNL